MEDYFDAKASDTVETILERIPEVIAWCAPRANVADPKGCLRTLLLNPLESNRKRIVEGVARDRYISLHHPPKRQATDLDGGRLFVYEPDFNLFHGLEEQETDGYVDVNNIPPWDTWVAYVFESKRNYLLSWVPKEFVSLVTAGISVNPEDCIRWLDKSEFELNSVLRAKGLGYAGK